MLAKNKIRKITIYTISIGFSLLTVSYGIICLIIFSDVKSISDYSRNEFEGDAVEATITLIKSDKYNYEMKNDAVWALGQIGDKRALPTLKELITGKSCEKPCPKNTYICQYELEKAIKYCKGAFSVTKWMYNFFRIYINRLSNYVTK